MGMDMEKQKMTKLSKEQESRLVTWFEAWWSRLPKGAGAKVGKGAARESWIKKFKKVEEDHWEDLNGVICQSFEAQEEYRKRVIIRFPDEQERKRAGIFLPSRPHPSTWLSQERWHDEVAEIKPDFEYRTGNVMGCSQCPGDSAVLVDGAGYCAWCWEKKFASHALEPLRAKARELGLVKRQGETIEDVAVRAREILKSKSSVWARHFQ
jgi:hypothetical protein